MVLYFPKLVMMKDFNNYLEPSKYCSDVVKTAKKSSCLHWKDLKLKYIKLFGHY